LGQGLYALTRGVFGRFTSEQEHHSGLDLPRSDGGPLLVVGQVGGLGRDPLEDVVNKEIMMLVVLEEIQCRGESVSVTLFNKTPLQHCKTMYQCKNLEYIFVSNGR
jgi:hypothetical protein